MVEAIIQEGIRNKELKNLDVKISTMALFGMCNWASTWYRPHGRLSIDEIAQVISSIYLEGMASPANK